MGPIPFTFMAFHHLQPYLSINSLSHVVDSCFWLSNEYTFNFTAHVYAPSSALPLSLLYKL